MSVAVQAQESLDTEPWTAHTATGDWWHGTGTADPVWGQYLYWLWLFRLEAKNHTCTFSNIPFPLLLSPPPSLSPSLSLSLPLSLPPSLSSSLPPSADSSTPSQEKEKEKEEEEEEEEVVCWVCQDEGNTQDLIQPCKCRFHRKCIQEWVMTVSPPQLSACGSLSGAVLRLMSGK